MKTFKEVSDFSNLLIVDTLNLCFRFRYSNNFDFKEDFIKTVDSLKKSYKAKEIILAADKGSSSYRKTLLPEYKQNRKDKFAEQTEEEKIQFEIFFEEYEKTIKYIIDNNIYPVLRFQGVEADDIVAYIVKNKQLWEGNIDHVWLISSDKDYDLLINKRVSRFSYVTRKEITFDNWNTHYECSPEDYISIKCLQGDSGDNVPGVPGIGPKKALALIREFGSAYDIIASIPIQSRYKYIQAINEFGRSNLLRNYKLMDLLEFCEEAIGKDNCETINQTLKEIFNVY